MNTQSTPKRSLPSFALAILLATAFGVALYVCSNETAPDLSALRAELHKVRARPAAPLLVPPQTDRIKLPPLTMARDPFVVEIGVR